MIKTLKAWWPRLSRFPFGKWLFSKLIGFLIPYTGSVFPAILEVSPGFAKVLIRDRRRLRNHLGSIHAIALTNVGEFTTGLALHFAMHPNNRAILTHLHSEFLKKARGNITALAKTSLPASFQEGSMVVEAKLFDDQENLVAKVSATWLIGKVGTCKQAKI